VIRLIKCWSYSLDDVVGVLPQTAAKGEKKRWSWHRLLEGLVTGVSGK
jgi:hypothetical protein